MPNPRPNITEPGLLAHCGRWIGTRFRGVKGADRLLRILHDPDRRQADFFRAVAAAYPEGPRYHLESKWFTEWTTWFYGSQDRAIHRWISANARPDWVAFDVGMNFGYFTCLLASRCKGVHGFEPVGWLAGRARANVELNAFANVTINELALFRPRRNCAIESAGPGSLQLGDEQSRSQVLLTDGRRGSSVGHLGQLLRDSRHHAFGFHESGRRRRAEHLVFRGGEKTLERMRPAIIFEYNAESGEESYRLLEKLGYGLFDLDQRALALQKAPLHDVLAIPKT